MIRLIGCLLLALTPVTCAWAQGASEFTIQVFGADDTVPPTTPVIQSVAPVTASQIDVTWSTSTDDFAVFGYVVFRDGLPVATTTTLFYSDTGLAASTTYTYTVTAFDGVPNYATTSAAVATTTPDVIIPPTTTSSTSATGGGTRTAPIVSEVVVEAGVATASVAVQTKRPSRIEIRFGTTDAYDLAYIVGSQFKTNHTIPLFDLSPDTTYYYEVIGYSAAGTQAVLDRGSFTTVSDEPPAPPANVSFLSAVQRGDDVRLTYDLPLDLPRDAVIRIVRNHFGYPQFLSDGLVVYEGTAETVDDIGVFFSRTEAYYTVFVVDPQGLISSGAIARVRDARQTEVGRPSGGATPPAPVTPPESDSVDEATSSPGTLPPSVIPLTGFPERNQFSITQVDDVWSFASTTIVLSSDESFTVGISADVITGDFKTIVATLSDPRDSGKQFSFLLRLTSDATAYTATIAPLRLAGVSDIVVEVFDYDTRVISSYETTVTFTPPARATSTVAWYWQAQTWLWWVVLFVPLVVATGLWLIFYRRDRADEDNGSL